MLKYLRIAVTALGLMACVLLVALWVRSYSSMDQLTVQGEDIHMFVATRPGLFSVEWAPRPTVEPDEWGWTFGAWPYKPLGDGTHDSQFVPIVLPGQPIDRLPFNGDYFRMTNRADVAIFIPFWLLAASALAAALLWMPRRFSLRTLLIATTLVAVGLGIIGAAS